MRVCIRQACEIRPWMFPEGWPELMYRSYHLRAALLPYIYTARVAVDADRGAHYAPALL